MCIYFKKVSPVDYKFIEKGEFWNFFLASTVIFQADDCKKLTGKDGGENIYFFWSISSRRFAFIKSIF